jgi:hypothetical protein
MKSLLAFALLAFVLVTSVFAATTTSKTPNSISGKVYVNPYVYLYGRVIDGAILRGDKDDEFYTTIRIQPAGTPLLYDESILFCGNAADFFNSTAGPIVIVYERVAHHVFHGVACHDIRSVNEVVQRGKP